MSPDRAKFRIYEEDAKSRQTTHWDLDYLPTADIEQMIRSGRKYRGCWGKLRRLIQRLGRR